MGNPCQLLGANVMLDSKRAMSIKANNSKSRNNRYFPVDSYNQDQCHVG
jgi:hypothetical protein